MKNGKLYIFLYFCSIILLSISNAVECYCYEILRGLFLTLKMQNKETTTICGICCMLRI